jgi:hypothetical protein
MRESTSVYKILKGRDPRHGWENTLKLDDGKICCKNVNLFELV